MTPRQQNRGHPLSIPMLWFWWDTRMFENGQRFSISFAAQYSRHLRYLLSLILSNYMRCRDLTSLLLLQCWSSRPLRRHNTATQTYTGSRRICSAGNRRLPHLIPIILQVHLTLLHGLTSLPDQDEVGASISLSCTKGLQSNSRA